MLYLDITGKLNNLTLVILNASDSIALMSHRIMVPIRFNETKTLTDH